jgi:hypothetical protein
VANADGVQNSISVEISIPFFKSPKVKKKPRDFKLAPIGRSIIPIFHRDMREDSGKMDKKMPKEVLQNLCNKSSKF